GLTVSAEEIIRDRKILKREAFLNLSKGSYLTSKIIILFGISAIQTFTFVLVGNTILEINGMLLPYWAIFFATSCFANLLGLNISSAFNSAVTIYILIPILLIPQLILSGVVVQFDKLNPALSSGNKVPIVGELMTSRWAFEAAIVHQFKSNEFERQFYPYDKVMGEAEFKKVYYIPRLLSKLDFCRVNYHDEKMKQEVENGFLLLKNEIGKELSKIGKDKFTDADKLNLADFNESVYTSTKTFLEALNRFYTNRFNKASDRKDKMIMALIKDDEGRKSFELSRNQNQNERIVQLVKNEAETHRITEKDGKLIAKFYPIYLGADGPRSPLNFRTQFYVPEKPFLGNYFDVFTFNLSIIWAMIIILIVTLYYDVLRKFIEFSSAISFSKK
ncbi:MAG: ABC transporter permease, partial [Ignavibacteriaceae bacterium]